ncbi:M20/M25/M40 family metallo-hydrolase [Spirochaetota bacterium]
MPKLPGLIDPGPHNPLLLELFISLLKTDSRTVVPDNKILNILASFFSGLGIDHYITGPPVGRKSVVAFIKGESPGNDGLILFSHADTHGWDESKWTQPPLSGNIIEKKIYGRGALDCKSLVAVEALIFALIAKSGIKPKKDICLIVTTDEEKPAHNGAWWALNNNLEMKDFSFALGEGGGYHLESTKGPVITCQVGEKGLYISNFPPNEKNEGVVRETGIKGWSRFHLQKMRHLRSERAFKNMPSRPDYINSLFSTFREVKGKCHIHYKYKHDPLKLIKMLTKNEILPENSVGDIIIKPSFSSTKSTLYQIIKSAAAKHGWTDILPVVTRGYSDARHFRHAGINTYGFFPIGKREKITLIHGPDEYIHIDTLHEAFNILNKITREYIF